MRTILAITSALLLCACESEAEHKAKWIAWCTTMDTTSKQCEVLYSVKHSADLAEESAASAQIMSGVSMGFSAASMGRR